SRGGTNRFALQKIGSTGQLMWLDQGTTVSPGSWDQWNPVLLGDGHGGMWVGWEDHRNAQSWKVYINDLKGQGPSPSPDPLTVAVSTVPGESPVTSGEIPLADSPGDQGHLALGEDGADGIFAAWVDNRFGYLGVYLQEINPQ